MPTRTIARVGKICTAENKETPAGTQPELKFDAVLMMVQTGSLSTDAAGWEISPIFAHQNAAKQTVRRPRKSKEKALKPSGFKAFPVAGAEGLEPSARGFGAAVGKRKITNIPLYQGACRHPKSFLMLY